jgi:hypothetical protein
MLALPVYRGTCCAASAHARSGPFTVRESTQVTPPKPRLLDRVRGVARGTTAGARTKPTSRGSNATSSSKRHPAEMGVPQGYPLPLLAGGQGPAGVRSPAAQMFAP